MGHFQKMSIFQMTLFLKINKEKQYLYHLYFNYTTLNYMKLTRYRKENIRMK